MTYTAFSDWVAAYKDMPRSPPGKSHLESLPNELLGHILYYIILEQPTTSLYLYSKSLLAAKKYVPQSTRNHLLSCVLTSRRLQDIALPLMYHNHFPRKSPIQLFQAIQKKPEYGSFVRSLDLTECSPNHLHELPAIFRSCTFLRSLCIPSRAFYINESIMQTLFECLYLESLEVVGGFLGPDPASPPRPVTSGLHPIVFHSLKRLSFRQLDLGADYSRYILSRCVVLRVLELKDCTLGPAMSYIHQKARIEQLHLSGYSGYLQNTADEIVDILNLCPIIRDSLEVFTCKHEWASKDFTKILNNLPPTLRSLQLTNSETGPEHIPLLKTLCPRLDEMNMNRRLTMEDVEEIVLGPWFELGKAKCIEPALENKQESAQWLSSIPNAVAVFRLQERIRSLTLKRGISKSRLRLRYLDLSEMDVSISDLQTSLLLGPQSMPLRIIALPLRVTLDLAAVERFCKKFGWNLHTIPERTWIKRIS